MHTHQPVIELRGHLTDEQLAGARESLKEHGILALHDPERPAVVTEVTEAVELSITSLGHLARVNYAEHVEQKPVGFAHSEYLRGRASAFDQAADTLAALVEHVKSIAS